MRLRVEGLGVKGLGFRVWVVRRWLISRLTILRKLPEYFLVVEPSKITCLT